MAEVVVPYGAKVLEVNVKAGDRVVPDQLLFRIEALKMMVPVHAPCGGRAVEVRVSPGDEVEGGTVLALIEEE